MESKSGIAPDWQTQLYSVNDKIDVLDLSVRVHNALKRAKIETIGDLIIAKNQDRLWKVRNLGEKAIDEIEAKIARIQLDESTAEHPKESNKNECSILTINDTSILSKQHPNVLLTDKVIKTLQTMLQQELRTGRLHPSLEFEGFPLGSLAVANPTDVTDLYARLVRILTTSASIADEIESVLSSLLGASVDSRRIAVLKYRYGYQEHTLASIGEIFSVTRERIRQIEKKALRLVRRRMMSLQLLRIRSALLFADDLDSSYRDWAEGLVQSGLMGKWSNGRLAGHDKLELLIMIGRIAVRWHRTFEFPVSLNYMIRLHIQGKSDAPAGELLFQELLPKHVMRLIRRSLRYSGAVSLSRLVKDNSIPLDKRQLCEILVAQGFTDIGNDWYMSFQYMPGSRRKTNVLHNSVSKMFQFCGPLTIRDVYLGIARILARTDFKMPPVAVLERMLHRYGYLYEEGLWFWDGGASEELNSVEKAIWKIIERSDGVVHYSKLRQAIVRGARSAASLHKALESSPVFDNFEKKLYKIRGTCVSSSAIERVRGAVMD